MAAQLAQQRSEITAEFNALMAAQMAAYEARLRVLESSRHVSEPEVTNVRAPPDLESPVRAIARSSVASGPDDVRLEAEDDNQNEHPQRTPSGQKSCLSRHCTTGSASPECGEVDPL
ncbi:uncharacterized protein LOC132182782 isoform X1 [Corylus avellana]|uniref:uncharacterized protein LOC132182782 isoform X1 n=2 Tax=Corylus avellana TaxID=13451 RepID=UPI001E220D5E|nr:uncharacterized protein LOC132182782 isoform X1 [Corylus avellana]XP_059452104.1 uncharacterized protein LOC132182782 isoform X1 [Corylus avellana]